jgi:WD40 repeat protein
MFVEPVRAQATGAKIEVVPILGHSGTLNSVSFSPDGARVLTGGGDATLRLWDAATGALLRTFKGHSSSVESVAFSPDGARVLSGSRDKTLKLWDAETGALLRTFEGHSRGVWSVVFSPDGARVLSASDDKTLKLWDVATGALIRIWHSSGVPSGAFSPDGTRVLSGGDTLKLWDAATGALLRTFAGHSDQVWSVAFSPDGARVLSGSFDKTLKLWDAATGALLRTFEGHSDQVWSVAFSPDGARVLSGSSDKTLKLWDAATGALLRTIKSDYWARSVAFSPDGTHVLSAGSVGSTLRLWDAATGALLRTFEGHSDEVRSVAFSPDRARVLSGSSDDTLKLWDAATGVLLRTFKSNYVLSVAFSPDGRRVLSGNGHDTIELLDAATGALLRTFKGHSSSVESVAFSPDGARVLSGSRDKTLKLWDAATGALIRTFEGHSDKVRSVGFSPDGTRVLSCSDDKTLKLWDAATGALLRTFKGTFKGHSDRVTSVAFSPDGSRVLSGSWDRTIRLWDAATGTLIRTFKGHSISLVHSVAFSPDGARVLSGSSDKTFKLWDAATGVLIRAFEGHSGWVNSVAFSPDGARVLSGSDDGTLRIWDVATGQQLVSLLGGREGEWLAITSEGFFAASLNGAKFFSVVRGLEVLSIEQFYQVLYRPDLVQEKLAGDPNGKVSEAAAKLDLGKLLDSGRVPKAAITSHVDTSPSDLVTLEGSLTDQGGGIGRVEWRINGITIGVVEKAASGQTITLQQTVALDPGDNTIELVAYNGRNLVASVPARTKVLWTGTEPTAPPRLHVLAVGINEYWDGKLKLKYAVPDAKSLGLALREAGGGLYEDVIVTEVFDGDASARHLDEVFAELSQKIRSRDVFVFYAAGHGVTHDARYYFIPQDFRYETEKSFAKAGIGQDRLQTWLAKIPAKKSILIFDTCQSGTLTNVQLASSRGFEPFEQKAALGRLIQATGRTTLTASLDNQPALEGYRGHGVFTFAMLDALARGDRNNNGFIEVTELIQHVCDIVPEITFKTWQTRQIPQSQFQGTNFTVAKQLLSLAPAPGEPMIISATPTHVNVELLQVFKEVGGHGTIITKLPPFTTVTLVKSEQGWVLIAKDGKALGYVADGSLRKLN